MLMRVAVGIHGEDIEKAIEVSSCGGKCLDCWVVRLTGFSPSSATSQT